MTVVESLVDSYKDFPWGLGLAIGMLIFGVYLCVLYRSRIGQAHRISAKEVLCGLAYAIYVVVILGGTVLNRDVISTVYRAEWVPFWSYYECYVGQNNSLALQIIYNVVAFVPWGVLLPNMLEKMKRLWSIIGSAALFSFGIEVVQYMLRVGLFEFDDIFHNALGALIGYGIWRLCRRKVQ